MATFIFCQQSLESTNDIAYHRQFALMPAAVSQPAHLPSELLPAARSSLEEHVVLKDVVIRFYPNNEKIRPVGYDCLHLITKVKRAWLLSRGLRYNALPMSNLGGHSQKHFMFCSNPAYMMTRKPQV